MTFTTGGQYRWFLSYNAKLFMHSVSLGHHIVCLYVEWSCVFCTSHKSFLSLYPWLKYIRIFWFYCTLHIQWEENKTLCKQVLSITAEAVWTHDLVSNTKSLVQFPRHLSHFNRQTTSKLLLFSVSVCLNFHVCLCRSYLFFLIYELNTSLLYLKLNIKSNWS